MTLWDAFRQSASATPDRAAIVLSARTLSFGELEAAALAQSHRLRLETETATVIEARDKIDYLTAFLAAMAAGRPAFPLDPEMPSAQRDAVSTAVKSANQITRANGDAEFYWGLSSGTTGEPKAFARTHRSWLTSFATCEAVFPFREGDVVGIPGSLYHSLFLYGAIHALSRGLSVVTVNRFARKSAARHLAHAGVTVLYAVPAMLSQWCETGFGGMRPRVIFCGGAKLDRSKIEKALPDADVVEFYGSSELSFVTYASTSAPAPGGSVGRPFPGVDVEVRDSMRHALPVDESGLIHVRSHMVFSRYLPNGDAVKAGCWQKAGDLGYLDAGGFLHLTGRSNRILNVSGIKISAEAIEAVLATVPGVTNVAVVPVEDAVRGQRAVAVLEGDVAPQNALNFAARCRNALGASAVPYRFLIIDRLPHTASGKIAVADVQAMVENHDAALRELKQ